MDQAAMKHIEDNTRIAIVNGERDGVKYLRSGYERVEVPAEAKSLKVYDIKSLVAALHQPLETRTNIAWWRRVLVGNERIIGIAQGALSGEEVRITLELPKHPAFLKLFELNKSVSYDQRNLIKLLRATFSDFVTPHVVALYRSLKVSNGRDADHVQDPAFNSLSASVRNKLESSGGKLPDFFMVEAPIYSVPELLDVRGPVSVLVESEPGDAGKAPTFELTSV
jgi:hypothetical protein